MLKLSRNGIGVLTSQYKSVLKKCVLLNMIAAGVFLFASEAIAAGTATGADFPYMGNTIKDIDTDPDVAYIYNDGTTSSNLTKEMFSIVSENRNNGWLHNYGTIYVGEKPDGEGRISVDGTVVSNKHNIYGSSSSSVSSETGGGAIANLNKNTGTGDEGAVLNIQNTTFQNNSATEFQHGEEYSFNEATGGAISNLSRKTVNITNNSRFISNYTMQFVNAYGGAFYNGFTGLYDEDYLNETASVESTGTYYGQNHVGNEYLTTVSSDVAQQIMAQLNQRSICADNDCPQRTVVAVDGSTVRTYVAGQSGIPTNAFGLTDNAFGGAVYNIGRYSSSNETYVDNYAIGSKAFGGAVYNSNNNVYDEGEFGADSKFDVANKISFVRNKAISYEKDSSLGKAHGGAVYNMSKLNFKDGSSAEFTNNSAESTFESFGGAIMNALSIIEQEPVFGVVDTIQNATFSSNSAKTIQVVGVDNTEIAVARGGAIYNAGMMTIADATFASNTVGGVSAKNYGGAIYNGANKDYRSSGVELLFDSTNTNKGTNFYNNVSQTYGGAIYNAGATIRGIIAQQMLFEGNTDAMDNGGELSKDDEREKSSGGAIYNAYQDFSGDIKFHLVDSGSILFKTHGKDNVYNDVERDADGEIKRDQNGNILNKMLIQFSGENYSAKAFSNNNLRVMANSAKSNVTTNASFLGFGDYEVINTELTLGATTDGAGYIGYNPTMKMAYNEVYLKSLGNNYSHLYLSSDNDAVINNDFYLDAKTVLRYDDKDASWVATNDNVYDFSAVKEGTADEDYSKGFTHSRSEKFYLGYYIDNSGYIVYNDENRQDTDIGIAQHIVNREGGVINSGYDGYITPKIHIGTLDSDGGKIYINMNNTTLVTNDTEHKLIPLDNIPVGYQFGYYEGAHYNSEVLKIDQAITGETVISFVTEADEAGEGLVYDQINLAVGQRIYFAQTPGDYGVDSSIYSFKVDNAVNPNYEIKIGYDQNDTVYDWFLYRSYSKDPSLQPEDMALIDLPRSAIEQLRSLRLATNRTNTGQCNCYQDECENQFCKYEDGRFKTRLWATPFYRGGTFDKPFETDFDIFGVDFGLDFQPTTKDEIGFFGSYRNGKYENDGNKKHSDKVKKFYSYDGSEIKMESWLGGAYYRRYIGDLYMLGALFGGSIDAQIKGKNNVKASVKGTTVGAQLETGYDIRMTKRSVLTPMLRGTYNYIDFDKAKGKDGFDKEASFQDIHNFEIEAALKLEYQFNNEHQLPTTGYIKPSIVQMLATGGEVTIDGVKYKDNLDNETIGRIEIGADAELIKNFSLGVFGNYSAGSKYKAWGAGGNVRIVW